MNIWVVEMWNEETQQWKPTVGVGLIRGDGRLAKERWQTRNPDDKFRLTKYVDQPTDKR